MMRRRLAALRPRPDVYTLAAGVMLVYAVGLYTKPNAGIAGFMFRYISVDSLLLSAVFLIGAVYVYGRRTPKALLVGTLPVAFYTIVGIAAVGMEPQTFNIAGIAGQAGFWMMLYLSMRGGANAD